MRFKEERAEPAETLAGLRELNCPVVMGNADAWLITGQQTSPGEHTSEQQHAEPGRSRSSRKTTWPLCDSSNQPSRSRWKQASNCSVFMDLLIRSTISFSPIPQMTSYASSWVALMRRS